MNYSSKYIESAVEAFSSLPSIGKKTALRLVLHLIRQEPQLTEQLADALVQMRQNIKTCAICHNISDEKICSICSDPRRDESQVCVVETIRDVMAIESTGQFKGRYHVLGGVLSPIEGIGPEQLQIESLKGRIAEGKIKELIMAISPTIEGDTTIFYISRQLKNSPVKISTIARGISFGGELEYADELTLGRSIASRIPYKTLGAQSGE
ncbi:MAG: recombination mediator RecR [Bacteroidota bacterium]